jgi:hypothetical protein
MNWRTGCSPKAIEPVGLDPLIQPRFQTKRVSDPALAKRFGLNHTQ